MPFYEYRIKSGACDVCEGCFVDLQKMSDKPHTECPDCGKECERVIAAPMVSVRGAEYRAAANAEKRTENLARAKGENAKLRESTLKKYQQLEGHTHNCALAGCYGEKVKLEAGRSEHASDDSSLSAASGDATAPKEKAHRYGGLPHLVGHDKPTKS